MPAEALPAAANPDPPAAKPPSVLKSLIKAIVFVCVVVVLEAVGASVLLPSAQETKQIAAKLSSAKAQDEETDAADSTHSTEELEVMREVNLGAFHILRYDPKSESSLNIDFELYAAVTAREESEFFQLYGINQRRIDEQINITMRGIEVNDLTDPGLGLIKRKILEKTNRALGKPLLREAIFSKFTFYER